MLSLVEIVVHSIAYVAGWQVHVAVALYLKTVCGSGAFNTV